MNDRLANAREFAVRLAPELESSGLTFIEHSPDWPRPPHAMAYAIRGPHLGIRDLLQSEGTWPGRWGAFVVWCDIPATDIELLAITAHEIAHLLPAKPPIDDDGAIATPAQFNFQRRQLEQLTTPSAAVYPWSGHGADWIRNVIHLAYRASQLGVEIPLPLFNVAGAAYGLSAPRNYQTELGAEPTYMARKSFAEIEAEPMPPRFTKLFERDCAEWRGLYQEQL